jgi:hypothetical protein
MFRRKGLYTGIVLTDSGEERSFFNVREIEPFMSFVDNWYIDWETVNVICQDTGEVAQTFTIEEFENKGVEFDLDDYIDPNSWESWL